MPIETPTDEERFARRTLADEIVEAVRDDREWPAETERKGPHGFTIPNEDVMFRLAQEVVMLEEEALGIVDKLVAEEDKKTDWFIKPDIGLPLVEVLGPGATRTVMFAILASHVINEGIDDPVKSWVGQLVAVIVPPNCSIHSADAAGLARVLSCARIVGEHWRNQDGINARYLDELGKATADYWHDETPEPETTTVLERELISLCEAMLRAWPDAPSEFITRATRLRVPVADL